MADKAVSALDPASALDGTEVMHVVQSGNSRQVTTDQIGDRVVGRANTFAAPQSADAQTLTHNTAWDGSAKQLLEVDVNGSNFFIANPTPLTLINRTIYTIRVTYTTSHGLGFDTDFGGASGLTATATAGAVDFFFFYSNGTTLERAGVQLDGGA